MPDRKLGAQRDVGAAKGHIAHDNFNDDRNDYECTKMGMIGMICGPDLNDF